MFLGAIGANREGGGRIDPPPARPCYKKCPARARVKSLHAQINVERGRFRSVFRDLVAKSPYLFNQGGLIRLTRNEALKRIIQGIELCKNIFCIVKTVSALER